MLITKESAMLVVAYVIFAIFALVGLALIYTAEEERYVLCWSDEFDGPAGTSPDASKWTLVVGGNGFGNNELESYTDRPKNACLDGKGNLSINIFKETFTGPDNIKREYTSARLHTAGKFSQQYGRFEARIKIPFGQGIWPAFWALGANIDKVGWPDCREIDIMENVGREPSINNGSIHGPGYSGADGLTGKISLPDGKRLCDDFHTYAMEWDPESVRFFMDGQLYCTRTAKDVPGKKWDFDQPFFILLNVAVGGSWPGSPDETSTYPQTMLVDYVRVYADKTSRDLLHMVSPFVAYPYVG
jgi:beta-glucanase (GH16 family)